MVKLKNNQNGFGAVEILLLLILIAIISFAGFYVWNARQAASNNLKASSSSTTTTTKSPSTPPRYLVIKDLGIKIKLNNQSKTAYYAYDKQSSVYYISFHAFDNNPELKTCAANPDNGQLGVMALVVAKLGQSDGTPGGGTWTTDELAANGFVQVGDSYYGFQGANGPCFDPTLPNAQQLAQTLSDYKHSLSPSDISAL